MCEIIAMGPDPIVQDSIWVADQGVLYRTTNGGGIWQQAATVAPSGISAIAVDRRNSQTVWFTNGQYDAGSIPQTASTVYKTTNATVFNVMNTGIAALDASRLSATPNRLLLPSKSLFSSSDGGNTWTDLIAIRGIASGASPSPSPSAWATAAVEPVSGAIYAIGYVSSVYKIYRSGAPSDPFSDVTLNSGLTMASTKLLAPPTGGVIFAMLGNKLYKCSDPCTSWTPLSLPSIGMEDFLISPSADTSTGNYAIYVWGFGATTSFDYGQSWTSVQLNGSTSIGPLTIDASNARIAYIAGENGSSLPELYKTTNGGTSYSLICSEQFGMTGQCRFPRVVGAGGILYSGLGQGGLLRSSDDGATWTYAGSGLGAVQPVVILAPNPGDPNTLFIGTYFRGVFKTTTGGQ
jgi:photosystem II stability/assembly factor-like uncharacterized protein